MSDEIAWASGLRSVPCGEQVPGPGGSPAREPSADRPPHAGEPHAARPERRLPDVVAVLAGEPWQDWPSRVHPALVAVAYGVHEHSSRLGRAALLPLAPTLVDTARVGFETSARVVATCVSTALAGPVPARVTDDEYERLRAAHATARHLLARGSGERPGAAGSRAAEDDEDDEGHARVAWWARAPGPVALVEPVYRRFAAPDAAALAVAVVARAGAADRDRRLRRLLRWCVVQVSGEPG